MKTLSLIALLFCWLLVPSFAKAETIAATTQQLPTRSMFYVNEGPYGSIASWVFDTIQEACAKFSQLQGSSSPYATYTTTTSYCVATNAAGSGYWAGLQQSVPKRDSCAVSGTNHNAGVCTQKVCPVDQNWTVSGSSCTRPDCAVGTTRDAQGICQNVCGTSGATFVNGGCQCPGASQDFNTTDKTCNCNAARVEGRGTSITGTGTEPDTSCYGGCVVNHGGLSVTAGVGASANWASQIVSFTSAKCTDAAPNAKTPITDTRTPEQKCLAAGSGYITTSGGTTCVSAGDSPNPVTKTTQTDTVAKDGTGAVTGSETTETTCVGSVCTSTTTTKNGAGVVTGSATSTGSGSGGGGGDSETDCDKYPNSAGCLELGAPPADEAVGTKAIESTITPVSMGSGVCPSDVNLPKGAKFSWAPVCDFAADLRPVIIALAWLAAAFIVLGFSRGN